jgi:hypothetical protein
MSSGYSSRSLVEKLGIKPGTRIAVLGAPRGYRATLGRLPTGVTVRTVARGPLSVIQYFVTRRARLEGRLATLLRALAPGGALWISWPKRASGVVTDLTEDTVRAAALRRGLVDVKVCAVDETWSGLKLVRRRRAGDLTLHYKVLDRKIALP